jgi:DNA topoisomerase-1
VSEASQENLVYVDDTGPGIRRVRRGSGFAYLDPQGRSIKDPEELRRIRKLAIPPAYTSVWICPLPNGHLQATGRDARGRKQYRYHAQWSEQRGARKFERLAAFGRALSSIRARVARDLESAGNGQPTRTVVLATLVRLLDTTLMRIGTDRYAKSNRSYGLTTLRDRHAEIHRGVLELSFRGKSGVRHDVTLEDKRIARIVRRCQELPGQELFQYRDADGEIHSVGSGDVNDYIAEAAGGPTEPGGARFTAKDFRTWHGTVLALEWTRRACLGLAGTDAEAPAPDNTSRKSKGALQAARHSASEAVVKLAPKPKDKGANKGKAGTTTSSRGTAGPVAGYTMAAMLAAVSTQLGNTPAVCRKAYIHPAVLELGTRLTRSDAAGADAALWKRLGGADKPLRGLRAAERRLLRFLDEAAREQAKAERAARRGDSLARALSASLREKRRSSR